MEFTLEIILVFIDISLYTTTPENMTKLSQDTLSLLQYNLIPPKPWSSLPSYPVGLRLLETMGQLPAPANVTRTLCYNSSSLG